MERLVAHAPGVDKVPYHEDSVLQKWIKPYYLRPDSIANIKEASKAKPFSKYAVLDNFFNEDVLDAYLEQHQALEFMTDDEGLPYDSNWAVAPEGSLGAELFYYVPWDRAVAHVTLGRRS